MINRIVNEKSYRYGNLNWFAFRAVGSLVEDIERLAVREGYVVGGVEGLSVDFVGTEAELPPNEGDAL